MLCVCVCVCEERGREVNVVIAVDGSSSTGRSGLLAGSINGREWAWGGNFAWPDSAAGVRPFVVAGLAQAVSEGSKGAASSNVMTELAEKVEPKKAAWQTTPNDKVVLTMYMEVRPARQ